MQSISEHASALPREVILFVRDASRFTALDRARWFLHHSVVPLRLTDAPLTGANDPCVLFVSPERAKNAPVVLAPTTLVTVHYASYHLVFAFDLSLPVFTVDSSTGHTIVDRTVAAFAATLRCLLLASEPAFVPDPSETCKSRPRSDASAPPSASRSVPLPRTSLFISAFAATPSGRLVPLLTCAPVSLRTVAEAVALVRAGLASAEALVLHGLQTSIAAARAPQSQDANQHSVVSLMGSPGPIATSGPTEGGYEGTGNDFLEAGEEVVGSSTWPASWVGPSLRLATVAAAGAAAAALRRDTDVDLFASRITCPEHGAWSGVVSPRQALLASTILHATAPGGGDNMSDDGIERNGTRIYEDRSGGRTEQAAEKFGRDGASVPTNVSLRQLVAAAMDAVVSAPGRPAAAVFVLSDVTMITLQEQHRMLRGQQGGRVLTEGRPQSSQRSATHHVPRPLPIAATARRTSRSSASLWAMRNMRWDRCQYCGGEPVVHPACGLLASTCVAGVMTHVSKIICGGGGGGVGTGGGGAAVCGSGTTVSLVHCGPPMHWPVGEAPHIPFLIAATGGALIEWPSVIGLLKLVRNEATEYQQFAAGKEIEAPRAPSGAILRALRRLRVAVLGRPLQVTVAGIASAAEGLMERPPLNLLPTPRACFLKSSFSIPRNIHTARSRSDPSSSSSSSSASSSSKLYSCRISPTPERACSPLNVPGKSLATSHNTRQRDSHHRAASLSAPFVSVELNALLLDATASLISQHIAFASSSVLNPCPDISSASIPTRLLPPSPRHYDRTIPPVKSCVSTSNQLSFVYRVTFAFSTSQPTASGEYVGPTATHAECPDREDASPSILPCSRSPAEIGGNFQRLAIGGILLTYTVALAAADGLEALIRSRAAVGWAVAGMRRWHRRTRRRRLSRCGEDEEREASKSQEPGLEEHEDERNNNSAADIESQSGSVSGSESQSGCHSVPVSRRTNPSAGHCVDADVSADSCNSSSLRLRSATLVRPWCVDLPPLSKVVWLVWDLIDVSALQVPTHPTMCCTYPGYCAECKRFGTPSVPLKASGSSTCRSTSSNMVFVLCIARVVSSDALFDANGRALARNGVPVSTSSSSSALPSISLCADSTSPGCSAVSNFPDDAFGSPTAAAAAAAGAHARAGGECPSSALCCEDVTPSAFRRTIGHHRDDGGRNEKLCRQCAGVGGALVTTAEAACLRVECEAIALADLIVAHFSFSVLPSPVHLSPRTSTVPDLHRRRVLRRSRSLCLSASRDFHSKRQHSQRFSLTSAT